MDPETAKTEDYAFGKEMAKLFVKNTVSSAAVYTGLALVLIAAGQIIKIKDARKAQKTYNKE